MGLVDYESDSDSASGSGSGSEARHPTKPTTSKPSQTSSKTPFQKVVRRSESGKLVVSLPTQAAPSASDTTSSNNGEPPAAKRARTGGGRLFSGFNSFLPPPKNTGKQASGPSSGSTTRPGVNLKTSAAPGFSRDEDNGDDASQQLAASTSTSTSDSPSGRLSLPPPKRREAVPTIPEGQKPAEEVKLVGKPLLFRPLSVVLNAKKKKNKQGARPAATQQSASKPTQSLASSVPAAPAAPAPEKKVSLFSMYTEEPTVTPPPIPSAKDAYEPLFGTAYEADASSAEPTAVPAGEQHAPLPDNTTTETPDSLDYVADGLNLSAAARRELFGRDGSNFSAKKVVNFNMDREYQHNEHVRASGNQQIHNPVRALQGGKHSLKQLVQNVQNQKEALEDSFAKGRSNRKEASSRYGW